MTTSPVATYDFKSFRAKSSGMAVFGIAMALTLGCQAEKANSPKTTPDEMLRDLRGSSKEIEKETGTGSSKGSTPIDDILKNQLAKSPGDFELPGTRSQEVSELTNSILQLDSIAKNEDLIPLLEDDPDQPWIAPVSQEVSFWDLTFFGNEPIGYASKKISTVKNAQSETLKIEVESLTRIVRDSKPIIQSIRSTSYEKRNGELIELTLTVDSGAIKRNIHATVSGKVARVTGLIDGNAISRELAWEPNFRGPFAIEQSLLRKPMKVKERRLVRYLDPLMARIVECRLESKGLFPTPTLLAANGGDRSPADLLEITTLLVDGDKQSATTIWCDERGAVLKSYATNNDVRVFRVEGSVATAFAQVLRIKSIGDVDTALELRDMGIARMIDLLGGNESIRYTIVHPSQDPYRWVFKNESQIVTSIDANTSTIEKKAETEQGALDENESPNSSLRSTSWISFDSPEFKTWVDQQLLEVDLAGKSVREKANLIKDAIRSHQSVVPFDNRLRRIEELVTHSRINEFEESTLLCAACREKGIPARIAIGAVINPNQSDMRMRLTTWVEIQDSKYWHSILPLVTQSPNQLDRIKLRETYAEGNELIDEIVSSAAWLRDARIQLSK